MRFIGPRPEVPEFVDQISFSFLEKIKPGLSGYSSILFRNESDIWSMIESDNPYKEILRIKGQHSSKISEILGYVSKSEVIHKDDMVEI